MPKLNGLSLKQMKFVDAYLGDAHGNGTKAAELAGYKGSAKALSAVASQNLVKPSIAGEIQKKLRCVMTSEAVLEELSQIARTECSEPVRMGDKIKALESLGKYHKLFNESVDVFVAETIERSELMIILEAALQAEMVQGHTLE